jgi:glycosyltransferase involved in cell wall biosynthesis
MHIPVSVIILTRNEAQDLPECLRSVAWSDDIHVYDSFSEDETVEVARSFNAKVTQRRFDNYASQRNAALQHLPFKYSWVLSLDADERIPSALAQEISEFVASPPDRIVACRIRRRDYLWNTWLKHAQMSPFYIRLFKPDNVRYERDVNEVLKADGLITDLREPFDHYPFSKGITHWIDKHNRYATSEAKQILSSRTGNLSSAIQGALWCRDFNQRRFYQKQLFYRLPMRPLIKLFYLMIIRQGFLDGGAGVTYSILMMGYEYIIDLKVQELLYLEQHLQQSANITSPLMSTPKTGA